MSTTKWTTSGRRRVTQAQVLKAFRELSGLAQCDECGDFVTCYVELDMLCLCIVCEAQRRQERSGDKL